MNSLSVSRCSSCGSTRLGRWSCGVCNETGTITETCNNCDGSGKITQTTAGCIHGYTSSHYYCNTEGCPYTGNGAHCSHLKTSQHDS